MSVTGLTGAIVDSAVNYQTPATVFSITLNNGDWHVILDPAGTLAMGTITMCAAPFNGQIINIRSSQTVTALTLSPNTGQSVRGNPSTIGVGGIIEAVYRSANTTWYF